MEQAAANTRAQLARAHDKEVALRKKMAEKLQTQLAKALEKQKALKDKKMAAIEKAAEKGTQGARNLVARMRETLRELNTRIKVLREEVKEARLTHKMASAAHSKFLAVEKTLEKFEREWSKKSAPKRKTRRRTRKSPAATTAAVTETTSSNEVSSDQTDVTETTDNV
jgi:hypothetical protein